MMNQGMHMGMNQGMNQGMNMGMMPQGNMTNMASMPGMMPETGFDSFLGSLLSTGFTLLLLVLFVAGTVFLARALWEVFKARKTSTQNSDTVAVARQVEVLEN